MKLILAQTNILWENKEENKKNCSKLISLAKNENGDLIVFPEMSLTGFSMNIPKIAESKNLSPTIDFFKNEAVKNKISVGFGLVLKKEDKAANHFIILDEKGNIIANYEKIHPFSFGEESEYFVGGNSLSFCKIKNVDLSPLVCYDLRFPELFQAISKKSQLILVIANWPTQRRDHWLTLLKSRAIENQSFVAGINRIGEGNGLSFSGDSVVFDPYGKLISQYVSGQENLFFADINPSIADFYRENFCLKSDRREDLYYKFFFNK